MKNKPEPDSDLILYLTEDGRTRLQVRLEGETVWLSLNQMADLFQRDNSVISRHIKNVFEEGELVRHSVVAESATPAADGKSYQVEYYNLDVIISVGYRVKSKRGTQFRTWATQRLREYIVKGFTMDDERLKNPPGKGHIDYFDEFAAGSGKKAGEFYTPQQISDILSTIVTLDSQEPVWTPVGTAGKLAGLKIG